MQAQEQQSHAEHVGPDHAQAGDEQASRGQGQGREEDGPGHTVSSQDEEEGQQHRHGEQGGEEPGAQDGVSAELGEGHHAQVVEELLVAELGAPGAELGPGEGAGQAPGEHQLGEAGVVVAVPLEEAPLQQRRATEEGHDVEEEEAREEAGPPGPEPGQQPRPRRTLAHAGCRRKRLYFRMHRRAERPSFQPIFFPSA